MPPTATGTLEETETRPWYLDIENPPAPVPSVSSPLLARQEIPPLPSNPPPLLSPLLDHLSTSIGLDDLTLLDLRSLSPPPALGANLLMVIGTARSVKHLNVSADRFCRWLRSTYKLRPYADGLLGRNELKLKLRRKARRLKLERAAGRPDNENADYGITTGWVCVNVGPVDHVEVPDITEETENGIVDADASPGTRDQVHEATATAEEEEDGEEYENPAQIDEAEANEVTDPAYVGFGSRATSQRIVVQMFTEEKRAEMNLEELWDARNTKRIRREEKTDARLEHASRQRELEELERSVQELSVEQRNQVQQLLRQVEEEGEPELLDQKEGGTSRSKRQGKKEWNSLFSVRS